MPRAVAGQGLGRALPSPCWGWEGWGCEVHAPGHGSRFQGVVGAPLPSPLIVPNGPVFRRGIASAEAPEAPGVGVGGRNRRRRRKKQKNNNKKNNYSLRGDPHMCISLLAPP
eukprot:3543818-Pyramimonas_sp.AAC.1